MNSEIFHSDAENARCKDWLESYISQTLTIPKPVLAFNQVEEFFRKMAENCLNGSDLNQIKNR